MPIEEQGGLMHCTRCGAEISPMSPLCRYCNAPVKPDRELSSDDREKIGVVVRAMEEILAAAAGNSMAAGISFVLLASGSIASYFLYLPLLGSRIQALVFAVITGCVSFVTFGIIVEMTERRVAGRVYRDDVKRRIEEYLTAMSFHRYEFDTIAGEILPRKAKLRRFLFMP